MGLVSISSSTCLVGMVPSIIIGAVASVCFLISKRLINRMEIDDPLNIVSIHLVGGLWGLLAAGIFQENTGFIDTGSSDRLVV